MPSAATLRARPHAIVAYVLLIEGIPQAWVTDHAGNGLLGNGASSWIGQFETASAWEVVGQRTVVRGLVLPDKIQRGKLDANLCMLGTSTTSFDIVDYDGTVARLFATEGKTFDGLGQYVGPTGTLGTSVATAAGGTVNPRGRYIGLERIGPSGQRGFFYPFAVQAPAGQEHVYPIGLGTLSPPARQVSLEPIQWVGRMAALYRLHYDADDTGAEYLRWTTLQDAHASGDLVWWGKLRDSAEHTGNRVWTIDCEGPESLLKKACATLTAKTWATVSVAQNLSLADSERYVGLEFSSDTQSGPTNNIYVSSAYDQVLPATGSYSDYTAALSSFISTLQSATTVPGPSGQRYNTATNIGGNISFNSAVDGANTNGWIEATFEFASGEGGTSEFRIKRNKAFNDGSRSSPTGPAIAVLSMHAKVWRMLGFEPTVQSIPKYTTVPGEDDNASKMIWFESAPPAMNGSPAADALALRPSKDYINATFTTLAIGSAWSQRQGAQGQGENGDGSVRYYRSLMPGARLVTLFKGAEFVADLSNYYLTPDPMVALFDSSAFISTGATPDSSRFFVFRGKRAVGSYNANGQIVDENGSVVSEIEGKEIVQVARVSWAKDTSQPGQTLDGTFRIDQWMDPRIFGLNYSPLTGSEQWVGISGDDEWKIEICPLNSVSQSAKLGDAPELDRVWTVLTATMASTGAATGYSGDTFTIGSNQPGGSGAYWYGSDTLAASQGLAIPATLLPTIAPTVRSVFDDVVVGSDAHSAINRGMFAWSGPYDSYKLIEQILLPRGLTMGLHGNTYTPFKLGLFARDDAHTTIGQSDLFGTNVAETIPKQRTRATGPVDVVTIEYGRDVAEEKYGATSVFRARDYSAPFRKGDGEISLSDPSLPVIEWYVSSGAKNRPAPWLGDFERLWSVERAELYAKRHDSITLVVGRVKGQSLHVGTRVLFTNPWVANADGTYGVTSVPAIVMRADLRTKPCAYEVELLVLGGGSQIPRVFFPIGKITSLSGTTVVLEADFLGHSEGTDAPRFMKPSWATDMTGELKVAVLTRIRDSWTLSAAIADVTARSDNTLTLSSAAFTGWPESNPYAERFLVAVGYDSQDANEWPRAIGSVIVNSDLTFGSGPTVGFPLIDE